MKEIKEDTKKETKNEKGKNNKIKLIIEIVIFVGALCAITGFYYFGGNEKVSEDDYEKVGIVKVNDDNFEEEVLNSDRPVILEFSSNSCPPCLTMIPTMISIAKNNKDIKVVNVNISEDNTSKIAKDYNIEAYPTIYILRDGEVVETFIGATNEKALLEVIK